MHYYNDEAIFVDTALILNETKGFGPIAFYSYIGLLINCYAKNLPFPDTITEQADFLNLTVNQWSRVRFEVLNKFNNTQIERKSGEAE